MYRLLFAAAAIYNVAFGIWAAAFPRAFFDWFELAPPVYPSIWACVGMVVGLYAPLYAYAARFPERGDLIIAVGLIGKVLGPIGWTIAVSRGELPPRTFPLILANDLIWWFPLMAYLLRKSRWREVAFGGVTVCAHLAACVGLLLVRGATEMEPEIANRWRWLADRQFAWSITWALWAVSSMSLLAFCCVWTRWLRLSGTARCVAIGGCGLIAIGLAFDLAGEVLQICVATRPGISLSAFESTAAAYRVLGPGVANGLYCVGGFVLSAIAWRSGRLRGATGALGFAVWIVGAALTVAALVDHRVGMIVSGAGVMILFIVWASVVTWRMRPTRDVSAAP